MATEADLKELLSPKRLRQAQKSPTTDVKPSNRKIDLDPDGKYQEKPDGTPICFPSPLHMLAVLRPDLIPYLWQSEELLHLGGFLDLPDLSKQEKPTPERPYFLCLPAANGSGKDLVIIASFAVWFALKGLHNYCFITSASDEQIKSQTNPHIRDLCAAANQKFGNIFRSVEKYHVCTQTASEIKLYVTDEEGRAEGYHPRFKGEMAMIFNEAKSIQLWDAFARCTGYSYWLEVSSPGGKSGHFYESSIEAISYPRRPQLGKYYLRHVSAYDCPHIPRSHIEMQKRRRTKEWFDSSVLALFSDYGQSNVIKEDLWKSANTIEYVTDTSYGIGGDLAAGGDECSFYLRKGPRVIDEMHFRQTDTTITAEIFDAKFSYVKSEPSLIVTMDDGGVGHAIIDNLVRLGWVINRRHNQSAANNKKEFVNLGAEMYFHLARLLASHLVTNHADPKLKNQICSRLADNLSGGRFRLEPKKDHIAREHSSPDRADAYVLAFSSYPLILREEHQPEAKSSDFSIATFEEEFTWGNLATKLYGKPNPGKPTAIRRI